MIRVLLLVTVFVSAAGSAVAEDAVPLEKQKGVRGRVVVAPELATTAVKLAGEREKAMRSAAIVKRPLGRPMTPLLEPPPALVVMLEGDGIKQENPEVPTLTVHGMRITPGSLVVPRAMSVHIANKQATDITLVNEAGAAIAKIPAGQTVDATVGVGEHLLHVAEMPFATASIRVLERGRTLPLKDGEIPLIDIPGGEYQLTFFFGAEPLRIQPLNVPDTGLVFIDATVSAHRVVEVSIKDASMRVAVPPGVPKEAPDNTP